MLAAGPPGVTGQALFDAATHEHDLRQAIGRAGDPVRAPYFEMILAAPFFTIRTESLGE